MVIYHASRQDLPSISPTQHPLLRLQSGPSAAMVEPLCPPLLRGDEASRAPAPQGLPTRVNHYKLKWVIVIYRLPEKAQIRSANPPSIWTCPILTSPLSLQLLTRAKTVGSGCIAIIISQRSILQKTRKLYLYQSPYVFPTIQIYNPVKQPNSPLLFLYLNIYILSCISSNPLSGNLFYNILPPCTGCTFEFVLPFYIAYNIYL